ncbi:tigger transposable element-derived protein 4-like [Melanaphis sacchari]|uniref:tigger transposable element-derived protein 4-like n=1 Tax=Melanaphis sacchari TaxID=742174 RepID=UPI000DC14C59|nr:tigger transposable element-derived protein 4-like [Melanaphis sacchari]
MSGTEQTAVFSAFFAAYCDQVFADYDKLPEKTNQRLAAQQLGIPQSTLNKLLKSRNEISNCTESQNRKRKRESKSKATDEALFMWFKQASAMNAPINRSILMTKANDLAKKMGKINFNATDGWLTRWKDRHDIVYKKLHGEKQDADASGADSWIKTTWPTDLNKYGPENIFNLDETGLYYRATPDYCMVLKNAPASAGKKNKARITVALTCNMTGVKNLPVDYFSTINAWMTSFIFESYLRKWDSTLDYKIALILDNCTAHPNFSLKNFELVFIPPNTTSLIQPLDQGIIKAFKTFYRSDMRRQIIDAIDDGQGNGNDIATNMTVLQAIHMSHNAWMKVTTSCIVNCFKKSGMVPITTNEALALDLPDVPVNISGLQIDKETFNEWLDVDKDLEVFQVMNDDEIAAEIVSHKEQGNDVEVHDEDEVEYAEDRVPVTRSEVFNAINTLRRAIEEHDIGTNYFDTLNNLGHIMMVSIPKKQGQITDFFKST